MDILNIVMIGIGHAHAQGVMYEFLSQSDKFKILGYVENNPAILEEKKSIPPFNHLSIIPEKDILNSRKYKVDAIVIETVMLELIPTAKKYLKLNVPIHLDKPTGWNDGFLELLTEAEDKKIPIQLGYMYRYNPAVCIADKYIRDNKIGVICQMDAIMDTELSTHERAALEQYPGGAMYVYGCHMLDMVLRWMGRPVAVYSFIKQCGFDGRQYDDCTLALLEYNRGTAIVRATCADANGYGRRQIIIVGEKGSIEIKPIEDPDKSPQMTFAIRDGRDTYKDKAQQIDLSKFDRNRRYKYMLEDFAYMIRKQVGKMLFPMNYEYERELHKLLMQAVNFKCGGKGD